MPKLTPEQIKERAETFTVCERTIRRWEDVGVNPYNLDAVANYLLKNDSATASAIESTINQLNER